MINKKGIKELIDVIRIPLFFVLVIWLAHIGKIVFDINTVRYGIFPRAVNSLKGIFLAPLIHGDFKHLLSNTIPLFALSLILFHFYRKVAVISFLIIYIFTGASVWLFSNSMAYHIGASGVVYGLVSFVFWSGIFRRNVRAIILALIVLVVYAGYFTGILPDQEGVSWESHLFGAIIGIVTAFIFKGAIAEEEREKLPSWANEPAVGEKYFFPPDIFDKTKAQRIQEQQDIDGHIDQM